MKKFAKTRRGLLTILLCLAILVPGIWVAVRNTEQIEQLKSQGKDYNVGFATVTPREGKPGESAYDIAVRNGFKGTELEWLSSLIIKPEQGDGGLSAYQIAVVNGFTGSQTEWLASLHGTDGKDGQLGAAGVNGSGKDGQNGTDGKDGMNGANGADGRTLQLACRDNTVQWKYTDEDDIAWRTLYSVDKCAVAITINEKERT